MESKTKKKSQKLPKWFDGDIYKKGGTVVNPFSGQSYELNALELSIYDMIIGGQHFIEMLYNGDMLNPATSTIQKDMARGLSWFRQNNAEAYMVLLD
jgi:hypothetical protein